MSRDIQRATISGRLTREPELRKTAGGTSLCSLSVASTSSYKDRDGQWQDKPNYFDVTVWGGQGDACARYLDKGSAVMIDGRLEHQTWEDKEGNRRSKVVIIADAVVFPPRSGADSAQAPPRDPRDTSDVSDIRFGGEEDIPF